MSLIVEDGTGLLNSNAYVSVADADSYFAARNNSVWSGKSTIEKETAILYATSYIDNGYYWLGNIKYPQQSLSWPRIFVYDKEGRMVSSDSVPARVKDSACELALEALSKPLVPSLARGGAVKRQKVASLEIEYFDRASGSRTFPIIEQILKGLFNDSPTGEIFRV